eukprot:361284-Chlamydomonas_euryale.AAC.3
MPPHMHAPACVLACLNRSSVLGPFEQRVGLIFDLLRVRRRTHLGARSARSVTRGQPPAPPRQAEATRCGNVRSFLMLRTATVRGRSGATRGVPRDP